MPKYYYRIKEYNHAYDDWFGKNKGWIYYTNEIYSKIEAIILLWYCRIIVRIGWKYKISVIRRKNNEYF
jgi:hypothetical protein